MPALLERQKTTFSTPGQLGDQGVFTSDQQPTFREGVSVFRYVVPSSTQVTLEHIVVTATPPNRVASLPGRNAAGTVKVRQSGVDKFESRLMLEEIPCNVATGSGDETVAPCGMAQRFDFHDGITFTSADTLAITIDPARANDGALFCATAWGTTAGVVDVRKGTLVPIATTTNQAILTFTPASVYVLRSITIDVVKGPPQVGFAMLVINGGLVCDLAVIGLSDTEPTVGLQAHRGLGVPLSGLDLWPGDVVEVLFAAWLDRGDIVDVQLAGNTAAIGGGGGGSSEHSFAFVG